MMWSVLLTFADEFYRMPLPPCPVILKPMLRPASILLLMPFTGAVVSSVLMFPLAPAPTPMSTSTICVVRLLRRSFFVWPFSLY